MCEGLIAPLETGAPDENTMAKRAWEQERKEENQDMEGIHSMP
jgi:hypothetical protein